MDLLNLSEKLYVELEDQVGMIKGSLSSTFEKFSESLFVIKKTVDELKKGIAEKQFDNEKDEINFFKNVYPKFYSWLIYTSEEYNISTTVPDGTDQMIREYYLQELSIIKRNFNHNQFAYQYFLHSETALDEDYFLRKNFKPYHPGLPLLVIDEITETNMGFQFAKFRAYEMLQSYLIRRIQVLYQNPENAALAELLIGKNRRWTGEKINLIELAYGIFYTGQMNNGKAELKEIIAWLESSLNVDLSQAYRMFLDIRRRKTTSYTKFLEQMAESIRNHIDESFNYQRKNKK